MSDEPRNISRTLVDSLRNVEAFQYGKAPEEFSSQPQKGENNSTEDKEKTGPAVKWILYSFLGVILLLVAAVVIRQFSGSTGKTMDRPGRLHVETEEDLVQSDFVTLAAQAESRENWRLAFRYRYLWVLQQLQEKNQIVWHPYKTDSDYLREVNNSRLKTAFAPLVQAYSFIWYGQKEITKPQYDRLQSYIQSFS